MEKKRVQVPLRLELTRLLDPSGTRLAARVEEAVVLELFQQDVISSGKAAEFLGISKEDFRRMLAERQIPYFRQSIEEILEDARVTGAHLSNRER